MLQSIWMRGVNLCHFMSLRHFLSFYVILCHFMSFYVILCLILCRSFPYFCLILRHDDNQQGHFMSFCVISCHFLSSYVIIQLSFVLIIVSNIPRHDVTINMIEEMTATVVQLQEENRYLNWLFMTPYVGVEAVCTMHTISFDWFLSGLEWILNFEFCFANFFE